jgi:hypothetical protein
MDTTHILETESYAKPTSYLSEKLGIDPNGEMELQEKIQSFQKLEQTALVDYLDLAYKRAHIPDDCLLILSGIKETDAQAFKSQSPQQILLAEKTCQEGLFIRWNGTGIVINPGENFLKTFHERGFFITDIDYCIVTDHKPSSWSDILSLYQLNFKLNKINPEHKTIHYFLNQTAFRELSHELKPNFKQERDTVKSLELFVDSPDVESIQLQEGIVLNYFATQKEVAATIGIQLILGQELRVGFLSQTPWTPFLASNLAGTDILIAAFGKTDPNDWGKLHYHESSLGYFGTLSLMEELNPSVVLCTEFDGNQGDLRMEVIRKFRKEFKGEATTILPGEKGMLFDIKHLNLKCSVLNTDISLEHVELVKSQEIFGAFTILSPTSRL